MQGQFSELFSGCFYSKQEINMNNADLEIFIYAVFRCVIDSLKSDGTDPLDINMQMVVKRQKMSLGQVVGLRMQMEVQSLTILQHVYILVSENKHQKSQ